MRIFHISPDSEIQECLNKDVCSLPDNIHFRGEQTCRDSLWNYYSQISLAAYDLCVLLLHRDEKIKNSPHICDKIQTCNEVFSLSSKEILLKYMNEVIEIIDSYFSNVHIKHAEETITTKHGTTISLAELYPCTRFLPTFTSYMLENTFNQHEETVFVKDDHHIDSYHYIDDSMMSSLFCHSQSYEFFENFKESSEYDNTVFHNDEYSVESISRVFDYTMSSIVMLGFFLAFLPMRIVSIIPCGSNAYGTKLGNRHHDDDFMVIVEPTQMITNLKSSHMLGEIDVSFSTVDKIVSIPQKATTVFESLLILENAEYLYLNHLSSWSAVLMNRVTSLYEYFGLLDRVVQAHIKHFFMFPTLREFKHLLRWSIYFERLQTFKDGLSSDIKSSQTFDPILTNNEREQFLSIMNNLIFLLSDDSSLGSNFHHKTVIKDECVIGLMKVILSSSLSDYIILCS